MDASQKQKIETQNPQPVGSVRKEGSPTINHEPFVSQSEAEPKLHPEVTSIGVETVVQNPDIPKEVEKLGLQHSAEAVKAATEPSGLVSIPLTEEQANQVINSQKHDSAIAEHTEGIYRTNSVYGLAILVRKIFSRMHGRLLGK